jgi:hypothetical protein
LGFEVSNYDEDGVPPYSACVTIELWRRNVDDGMEHYLKVFLGKIMAKTALMAKGHYGEKEQMRANKAETFHFCNMLMHNHFCQGSLLAPGPRWHREQYGNHQRH